MELVTESAEMGLLSVLKSEGHNVSTSDYRKMSFARPTTFHWWLALHQWYERNASSLLCK